jgi:riboflavin synthase
MFTGLVQQIGEVVSTKRIGLDTEIRIAAAFTELADGESIAVDGACLTVTQVLSNGFLANASAETLERTNLPQLKNGAKVHLERALRLEDRLGGHIVSGHVDGVGIKTGMEVIGRSVRVTFKLPSELAPFVAPKGAIAIDGASLTVNGASGVQIDVVLVPFTRAATLIDKKPNGSSVNVEVDLLAKYVARLLGKPGVDGIEGGQGISFGLLAKQGFL